jgi:hypothetical protein
MSRIGVLAQVIESDGYVPCASGDNRPRREAGNGQEARAQKARSAVVAGERDCWQVRGIGAPGDDEGAPCAASPRGRQGRDQADVNDAMCRVTRRRRDRGAVEVSDQRRTALPRRAGPSARLAGNPSSSGADGG